MDDTSAEFVLGGANAEQMMGRMAQLKSRAQAAAIMEKPWPMFRRESCCDWADAPVVFRCQASSYDELLGCLDRARRRWANLLARQGADVVSQGRVQFGADGCMEFRDGAHVASASRLEAVIPGESGPSATAEVGEQVLQIAAALTGYNASDLRPEADWQRDLAVDSLKLAELICALGQRFGLPHFDNLDVSTFPTVSSLVGYIQALAAPEPGQTQSETKASVSLGSAPEEVVRPVVPVVEVGVLRGADQADLLRDISAQVGRPCEALRLRSTEGWLHRRHLDPSPYVVSDVCRPLLTRSVRVDARGRLASLGEPVLDPIEVMSWLKYRMDNRPNAWYYTVGAIMAQFLGRVEVPHPGQAGPKLFLSNHQTALEGYVFPLLAPILTGLSLQGVAMRDNDVPWADDVSAFLFSHAYFPRHLLGTSRSFMYGDTLGLLHLLPALERDLRSGAWGLHIVASGQREWVARTRLREVSSVWLELAMRLNMPVVPVRFSGCLPLEDPGHPSDLPWGLGRLDVRFGAEIAPEELTALTVKPRKMRVLQALNDFCMEREVPNAPQPDLAQEWQEWRAFYGGEAMPTLVFCCLRRFVTAEVELERQEREFASPLLAFLTAAQGQRLWKRSCRLLLPDNADGRWVGELARRVMGAHAQVGVHGEELSYLLISS